MVEISRWGRDPKTIDKGFYRAAYKDVASFSDEEIEAHYFDAGISEGRIGHPKSVRENLSLCHSPNDHILEIGPFCYPVMAGPNVKYFDVLDRDALLSRASEHNLDPDGVPDQIDYVSPTGDLSVVQETFDCVFSSHCLEHQPDLIAHLNSVESIIKPGGKYLMIIPDKRFCFDHYIAETTLADVLEAWLDKRKNHTIKSVVEHVALTTHNVASQHWRNANDFTAYFDSIASRAQKAIDLFQSSTGYIDVHAWQFTPISLRTLLELLKRMSLINFDSVICYETPKDRLEFIVEITYSDAQ